MSTQATASATLKSLLSRLIDRQEAQQAQLDAIKDALKANKDEGAVIAKPAIFKGDAYDVARFLPMFRNWATEQKALRIKAGQGVTPEDVGKLDHRRTRGPKGERMSRTWRRRTTVPWYLAEQSGWIGR
ncbi:hypothetical protein PQX77_000997 [Marasmius sp. AFHP31]|nr:hypothetical protein PQX77_000997 [Marasmius sp. AFHP31]